MVTGAIAGIVQPPGSVIAQPMIGKALEP